MRTTVSSVRGEFPYHIYSLRVSKTFDFKHCPHTMRSRVYVMVRRPSVCLLQHGLTAANPLLQVCCCELGGQEISIDCAMASAQQQRRAAGECGQCRVVSVRRKVNLFFSSSVKTVPLDTFHWQDYPRRKLTVVY